MSTCNQLDLESLGSSPTMPKNFPDNDSNRRNPCYLKYYKLWCTGISAQITTSIIPISVCCYSELRSRGGDARIILPRLSWFTNQSRLCSMMFEQPSELLLVKVDVLSKTLLHCITPKEGTSTKNWHTHARTKYLFLGLFILIFENCWTLKL